MEENLFHRKALIIQRISQLSDILQGTIVARRHKCGKPNCRCKTNDVYLHSSRQLTFSHKGKTRTITIPKDKLDHVVESLDQFKEFRKLVKRMLEINRLLIKKKTLQATMQNGQKRKEETIKMPGPKSPFRIQLSEENKEELEGWLRKTTIKQALSRRAKIILLADDKVTISDIERQVGVGRKIVRKWIKRYIEFGIKGLYDKPRSGRPPEFSPRSKN